MIIGRGLLANALKIVDSDKYIFYVNGISNSSMPSIPEDNFERIEIEKLSLEISDKILVYVSSSQLNSEKNSERAYVKHKFAIEQFVIERFPKYLIIRTSNLVGFNPWNKHTLYNYLHSALLTGDEIKVDFQVIRNFLDADHFITLLATYLTYYQINKTIEIVNPESFTMREIIVRFEQFYSKKFIAKETDNQSQFAMFELDTDLSKQLCKMASLTFDDYIGRLLTKYYGNVSLQQSI